MATSYQGNMEKCAVAKGNNLSISWKASYEIANAIRNKDVKKVIAFLERVIVKKQAVPYKRFNSDVGHRPGKMASGRYPIEAATKILAVVKNAVSNAKDKGLDDSSLELVHVSTCQGPGQWHYGRQRRRKMKSTHIDVVVKEVASSKPAKKEVKKAEAKPKTEAKTEVKAEVKSEVKAEKPKVEAKAAESKDEKVEAKVEETKEKAETTKVEDKE